MFAAADVFAEVDARDRIVFATGVTRRLCGRAPEELAGLPAEELVHPADVPLLRRLLAFARRGGRTGPVEVRGRGTKVRARLRALALPDETVVRLAFADLMPASAATSRLPDGEALLRHLEAELAAGGLGPAAVSVFALSGLAGRDPDVRTRIRDAAAAVLRLFALADRLVAEVGEEGLGVVHVPGSEAELERELGRALAEEGAGDIALSRRTVRIAPPAGEGEVRLVAEAVAFALREFARGGAGGGELSVEELLQQRMQRVMEQVRELRRRLKAGDFALVYQPIVRLADGTVHHYEALLRAAGETPAELVRLAEEVGLAADLDLAVCERVLKELAAVDAARRGIAVAVNVSVRSLEQEGFAGRFLAAVRRSRVPAQHVLVEVTETFLARDFGRVGEALQELRRAGHHICIDDFGAGAASFARLQDLPLDTVKIDGRFVRDLLDPSGEAEAVVASMMEACRRLRLSTIAEHVETERQRLRLLELGVDLGQGHLFGRGEERIALPKGALRLDVAPASRRGGGEREVWA